MCDTAGGDIRFAYYDSIEKFKDTNTEDVKPVYEEITSIKTEVVEEFYDYRTMDGAEPDDMKPFSSLECFQSVTDEYLDIGVSPYEQTFKDNCYEQHTVQSKKGNNFGLSTETVGAKIEKKYACDKCSYITKSRTCFLRHVLIHDKRQLKCETCRKLFKRRDMLEKHSKAHCKQRQQHKCDICSYVTKRKAHFRRHVLLHGGKKQFKCEICGTLFRQKDYLKKHALIKHNDGPKLYKCKYCEYSAHYKTTLENHERTHPNVALLKCTYTNCTCEQLCASNKEKSCHCDPCHFETAYRDRLSNHILRKHSAKAKRYTCTFCTYSTHFKGYLSSHVLRIHTSKKSPAETKSSNCDLKKHIMRAHASTESPNKYKCEYCHHTTHSKENLKKHTLIHTKEKIFKCTYINCKCAQQRDCIGERYCDCEACSYQTIHKSALKSHILTKHSGEAKKHTCTYCNYSSHFKGNLKCHLLRKHANAKSTPSENS